MLAPVIDEKNPLGLGSASPRRKALLETLRIPLLVIAVDADERRRGAEGPDAYLERVTRDKLTRVAAEERALGTSSLLVADTIVLLGDDILGKPANVEEATAMLTRLSGCCHEVRTRFLLGPSPVGKSNVGATVPLHAETVRTMVHFRPLEGEEIRRYAATGEGMDKAGAYAVQGVGSFAVQRIEGSYANVVGLPVCEVVLALRRLGLLPTFP
ncbi:MAG TPA: Maf family protein [Polyangiaceae bacterium]|jgi:septum formation protein|nr:Maf family protein [Polyangiaceae bacterium]